MNRKNLFLTLSLVLLIAVSGAYPMKVYANGKEGKPLKGMIVGIDPGHQLKGNSQKEPIAPNSSKKKAKVTSGTTGKFSKVPEHALNLQVGLKMKKHFESLGAKVVMTREKADVDISNIQRAKIANEAKCDIVLRLHADGIEDSKVSGYSILVPSGKYTEKIQKKSTNFAKILDKRIAKDCGEIKSRGLSKRADMTGFNWSTVPVIILEMGFMSNKHDDMIMQTEEYQKKLVSATANALIEYKGAK